MSDERARDDDEAPDQPRDSYRALLQLKAGGFKVEEFVRQHWRREEELLHSAMHAARRFRHCGLGTAHL